MEKKNMASAASAEYPVSAAMARPATESDKIVTPFPRTRRACENLRLAVGRCTSRYFKLLLHVLPDSVPQVLLRSVLSQPFPPAVTVPSTSGSPGTTGYGPPDSGLHTPRDRLRTFVPSSLLFVACVGHLHRDLHLVGLLAAPAARPARPPYGVFPCLGGIILSSSNPCCHHLQLSDRVVVLYRIIPSL